MHKGTKAKAVAHTRGYAPHRHSPEAVFILTLVHSPFSNFPCKLALCC
jgi:hypothetical protein